MNDNYENNYSVFNNNYLSTNDVLIVPSTGTVKSRKDINLDLDTFIYASPMDTVSSESLFYSMFSTNQAALACRFNTVESRLKELDTFCNQSNYWFTVGSSINDYELLYNWSIANPKARLNIAVDVAHGDTVFLHKIYRKYRTSPWCKNLMSGTVATYESASNCFKAGCTHIRVGIGPGSACSTRIVTGCGVPNLTAVWNVWDGFADCQSDTPKIIADGGIKTSGDIAKYLAAGADGVMIGSLLSKTIESGGWKKHSLKYFLHLLTFKYCFKKYLYKSYRGQASAEFQLERRGKISGTPEGVQATPQTPKYSYLTFYDQTCSALRSTLSYTGLKKLKDLNPESVRFIKITQNAFTESTPHILS
jgi:IMP dehydrogenase